MIERPWTSHEVERLVALLSERISPFGFTVESAPPTGLGIALSFHPTGFEEIKTRTSGLVKYLRDIWGNATPIQASGLDKGPQPNYIRGGDDPLVRRGVVRLDDDPPVDRLGGIRHEFEAEAARIRMDNVQHPQPNPFQQDSPFVAPVPQKSDPKRGRYRYAFTRPDGGKITVTIF